VGGEVVTPRPDSASGRSGRPESDADLSRVFLDKGPSEYREAIEFFDETFITDSLRNLLSDALLRITGQCGDPVVELRMNAGAGKTHSMMALYHLFCGLPAGQLHGMEPVARSAGVSQLPRVHRAVLVGNRISPADVHVKPDGTVVRTLWGELAWQLGGRDGYEMVREADENATSPGGSLLFLFQRFSPCLILIDEWAAYACQIRGSSRLPAGDFDTHLAFAHALGHCVRRTGNALLLASFPNAQDETSGAGEQAASDLLSKALEAPAGAAQPVDESRLLDDLFRATVSHHSSQVYRELLDYVSRFRRYSAYNGFLVRVQRPTVGYVATPSDWMKEFERRVKPDARPLVMLRPFGPVMFVFDIADTEGKPAPLDLMNPFDAKGELDPTVWDNTVGNCSKDRIQVIARDMQVTSAGWARCTVAPGAKQLPEFEVTYNKNQKRLEAYCTLVHELAHIYLGHVCGHPKRKWPDRRSEKSDVKEFEAESVAYVVCARQGVMTTAPQYLADYLGHNDSIPAIDIHRVLVVASKIEEMGRTRRRQEKQNEEEV